MSSSIPTFFIQVSHPTPTLPIHCTRQPLGKERPLFKSIVFSSIFIVFHPDFTSNIHHAHPHALEPVPHFLSIGSSPQFVRERIIHMGHYREACVFIHTDILHPHIISNTSCPSPYTGTCNILLPICSSSNLYVKNNIHGHYRDAYVFIHAEISSSTYCIHYTMPIPHTLDPAVSFFPFVPVPTCM